MKILLTGYEPFGGSDINPSWEVARSLNGEEIGGAKIIGEQLPVTWERALPTLYALIEEHSPDAVVCLGQAGRAEISPERVGLNVSNGKDNDEVEREEVIIAEDGPDAYFSTLPFVKIAANIREAGIPAKVSNSAGTYLCNTAAYGVRHYCELNDLDVPAGFIHIPSLPQQVAERSEKRPLPSMALDMIRKGIVIALETVAEEPNA